MSQLNIFKVHTTENCETEHLEKNHTHFSKQCEKVFDLLMRGQEISVISAIHEHNIMSLPRRIKDLKECGVKISDKWIECWKNKPEIKHWYLSKKDKEFNQQFLNV